MEINESGMSQFAKMVIKVLSNVVDGQRMTLNDGEGHTWTSNAKTDNEGIITTTYIKKDDKLIAVITYCHENDEEIVTILKSHI